MGGANLIQRTVHAIGEEKYKSFNRIKKTSFMVDKHNPKNYR